MYLLSISTNTRNWGWRNIKHLGRKFVPYLEFETWLLFCFFLSFFAGALPTTTWPTASTHGSPMCCSVSRQTVSSGPPSRGTAFRWTGFVCSGCGSCIYEAMGAVAGVRAIEGFGWGGCDCSIMLTYLVPSTCCGVFFRTFWRICVETPTDSSCSTLLYTYHKMSGERTWTYVCTKQIRVLCIFLFWRLYRICGLM